MSIVPVELKDDDLDAVTGGNGVTAGSAGGQAINHDHPVRIDGGSSMGGLTPEMQAERDRIAALEAQLRDQAQSGGGRAGSVVNQINQQLRDLEAAQQTGRASPLDKITRWLGL